MAATSFVHSSISFGVLLTLGCSFQDPYEARVVEAGPGPSGDPGSAPVTGSGSPDDGRATSTEGPGAAGAGGAASAERSGTAFEGVANSAGKGGAAGGSNGGASSVAVGDEQLGSGGAALADGGKPSVGGSSAMGDGTAIDGNLIPDPSFETGFAGWFFFGASTLALADGTARTGDHSLASSSRTRAFEGPAFDIEPLVQRGAAYDVALWVLPDADNQSFKLSLKTRCRGQTDDEATYSTLDESTAASSVGWSELAATFTAPSGGCALAELFLYVEGPHAGVSFFVDDVSLFEAAN